MSRATPAIPLILRRAAQLSLEGALQLVARSMELSVVDSAALRHLRMRVWVGDGGGSSRELGSAA